MLLLYLVLNLTTKLRHGRGHAAALKAELHVAGQIIYKGGGAAPATHTEGAVGGDHILHLAEGTSGRHNSLAHVTQYSRAGCLVSSQRGEQTIIFCRGVSCRSPLSNNNHAVIYTINLIATIPHRDKKASILGHLTRTGRSYRGHCIPSY